jgi:hypothetical protein
MEITRMLIRSWNKIPLSIFSAWDVYEEAQLDVSEDDEE